MNRGFVARRASGSIGAYFSRPHGASGAAALGIWRSAASGASAFFMAAALISGHAWRYSLVAIGGTHRRSIAAAKKTSK